MNNETRKLYDQQGLGQRIGFGQRPAVMVIDMQHDLCDPMLPLHFGLPLLPPTSPVCTLTS